MKIPRIECVILSFVMYKIAPFASLKSAVLFQRTVPELNTAAKAMRTAFVKIKDFAFTAIIHAKLVQAAIMPLYTYSVAQVAAKMHGQLWQDQLKYELD